MSTMTKTGEHLLYLMACALQGVSAREEVLADADLKQLLIMARKHSVASMVCMALEKTAIFANADEATKKQRHLVYAPERQHSERLVPEARNAGNGRQRHFV